MNGRLVGHGIAWVGLLIAGLWLADLWLVMPWVVAGESMEPALRHGDRVLVDRWTYRHRAPRVGELILFEAPEGAVMVKRVAAAPAHARYRPERWGPGEGGAGPTYWLIGDNPASSRDSRRFGPVPAKRVLGRVVLRYWPPFLAPSAGIGIPDSYNSRDTG